MLLHHPPLSSYTLTSTINPYLTHLTLFKANPNLRIKSKRNAQAQRASSSNPEQTQITEKHRTKAEDDTSEEDESFTVVSAVKTMYNDIFILDTKESMVLLLDQTHNVHSIFYKGKQGYWTDSYWDEFAALPSIIPPGRIAIYGLGGGTAAHILLYSYPHLEIEGWEIDGVLVDKARDYLGLKELESVNDEGGVLNVFVGDAITCLTESSNEEEEEEKYAGIIVDLFSNGKVLDEMKEKEFWVGIKKRLRPGGRVMVNCGGAENVAGEGGGDDEWVVNLTVEAMWEVFKGELCWKKMQKMEGANYMAVTGEMPDLGEWEGLVPDKLKAKVWGWMPFPNVPMQ